MAGTSTSVVRHKVIVFRYGKSGGEATSRTYLDDAVKRLAARYGFSARVSGDAGSRTERIMAY